MFSLHEEKSLKVLGGSYFLQALGSHFVITLHMESLDIDQGLGGRDLWSILATRLVKCLKIATVLMWIRGPFSFVYWAVNYFLVEEKLILVMLYSWSGVASRTLI